MNEFFHKLFKPQNLKYLLFLVIPAVFLTTCFNFRKVAGPNSFINADPDYVYLYSGVIMGDLHFRIEHIDHPGTPVQVVTALVTRTVHLFTGEEKYLEDVLVNADYYMRAVNTFFLLLVCAAMMFVGIGVYKQTGFLLPSILLQLSPLGFARITMDYVRLIPDVFLVIPILFLVYYLIRVIYKDDLPLRRKTRMFSIFTALTLSFKISSFPILLIPLMLFNSAKERFKFVGQTILWFLVFSFPVLIRFEDFFNWIKDLFIHSGHYGNGEKNIIDIGSFFSNIIKLVDAYPMLYYLLAALLMAYLFSIYKAEYKNKLNRITLGMLLAGILQTLLIAKHYADHYMFPILFLVPLMGFVLADNFSRLRKWIPSVLVILLGAFLLFETYTGIEMHKKWKEVALQRKQGILTTCRSIVQDKPLVIVNYKFNYIFPETSLMFGCYFIGPQRDRFREELTELYPGIYHYNDYIHKILYWGQVVDQQSTQIQSDVIYLFFNNTMMNEYDNVLAEIGDNYKVELVFQQEITNDKLFRATRIASENEIPVN